MNDTTRFGLTPQQTQDLKELADHIVERNGNPGWDKDWQALVEERGRDNLKWFREQYLCDPGPDPTPNKGL